MPRTKNTFQALVTRIAFLSVNGSEAATEKVKLIVWTLQNAGVNQEKINQILEDAKELADTANEA